MHERHAQGSRQVSTAQQCEFWSTAVPDWLYAACMSGNYRNAIASTLTILIRYLFNIVWNVSI